MSKQTVNLPFSQRLREAMISAGHSSTRSNSGVCIQTLTELTGNSRQICRKYLQGEVLPEPQTLLNLAHALKVSPGWLLFGEDAKQGNQHGQTITINKNLLHYVLTQQADTTTEIPDFLVDLIQEISTLDGNEAQLKKIIDLALSSAKRFNTSS